MKNLKVGIATAEEFQQYTLAIARGELKPDPNGPKVWFNSIESFAKVLSAKNRKLLRLIADKEPESLTELEAITGRKKPNLSRTLKTLERYGLVTLQKGYGGAVIPKAIYDHVSLELAIGH